MLIPGLLRGEGGLAGGLCLTRLLRLARSIGTALFFSQPGSFGAAFFLGYSGGFPLLGYRLFQAGNQFAQALVILLQTCRLAALLLQPGLNTIEPLLACCFLRFKRLDRRSG